MTVPIATPVSSDLNGARPTAQELPSQAAVRMALDRIAPLTGEIHRLNAANQELEQQLAATRGSLSWKVTKPLRSASALARHGLRRLRRNTQPSPLASPGKERSAPAKRQPTPAKNPSTMPILASIVMPVYNTEDYVEEALRSALDQQFDPEQFEVIAIDDGSTDSSLDIMQRLANEYPHLRLFAQEHTGTGATGRNAVMASVRGEYVMFLGSDDVLDPDTLANTRAMAKKNDSDIVLYKMAGLGGRIVPTTMFHKTVDNADLITDHVARSLSDTKLFRKSLIADIPFPTNTATCHDEPVTVAAYTRASVISVLADKPYYYARHRADRSNLTLRIPDPRQYMTRAGNIVSAVKRSSLPQKYRDALNIRAFDLHLAKAFNDKFLAKSPSEQSQIVTEMVAQFGESFTPGVSDQCPPNIRILFTLATAGHIDQVLACVQYWHDNGGVWQRSDGDRLVVDVPDSARAVLAVDDLTVNNPKLITELRGVALAHDVVTLSGYVGVLECADVAHEVGVELKARDGGETRALPLQLSEPRLEESRVSMVQDYRMQILIGELSRGVWDVFLRAEIGDLTLRTRVGHLKDPELPTETLWMSVKQADDVIDVAIYFTRYYANVSIDVGGTVNKRPTSSS